QGELVGVIVGVVDPNRISEVMLETSGLGKTGETYLVNKFNYVVTELKNKKSAVDIALYSNVVKDCLKGNAGFSLYENYVNKPVVGFYRWIPNLEVCLLAEMDQEEAFEPVSNLKKNVTTLSILIILGVSLLAILFSGTLTKPISQLHKATEQLMKGDFTAKTNIKSGDEIEDLGRAFNKTVDTLKVIDEERKQIDKAKTEFLSITSHELRSPMTPMKAQLQMLLEGYFGELNDKQKESLKIILKNADRLDNLIVDFLEISRIEAGRLTFVFQKTDLSVDIKETVDYMQSLCLDKKIKISLKMDELPVIEVDPNRVMQVLRNLLDNAIKFSNPNSKIEVAVKKKKDHLLFSVKDYGIGISVEDQPKLFQPFFRAEKTLYRQYSGTGLGLAICKGIVESQNGKIWVESESGKGSTFYFTVPFKPVKEIKPITLLFFQTERIEAQLRDLFSNVLGPLGEHTFEELKSKNELNKPKLLEYTNYLLKEGVLSEEKSIYMKNMIKSIFGEKVEAKTAIKKIKRWVDIF
ncbi:MAG: ATP-binding protein, partial [Candidatus Nanoarchaeia archaeon]